MGNLTFDGVDSEMLHLGDDAGMGLDDAIRLESKPIAKKQFEDQTNFENQGQVIEYNNDNNAYFKKKPGPKQSNPQWNL